MTSPAEPKESSARTRSFATIAILIFAGEAVFLLPFVLPRIFRPTVLQVFEMNDSQLGRCFSIYGMVALLSYLFGGPLADRFSARKLMAISLWLTSLGGFVIATYPSHATMEKVYGYWGVTTIFLFWAAMLRATRQWGGDSLQGRAFGFLDGGRGLVSAVIGTIILAVYWISLGQESAPAVGALEQTALADEQAAFRPVILTTSALVIVSGLIVWWFLREQVAPGETSSVPTKELTIGNIGKVPRIRSIWMLMIIVLCGYVGYKSTDDISKYAQDVMLYDNLSAAAIANSLLYLRPVVGVIVGVMADRTRVSTWILCGFAFALIGAIMIATGINGLSPIGSVAFFASLVITCMGVYAIRSLYFAAMQEGQIPLAITGTAVGLISVVGYTPEIFMGPVMGRFLDGSPGETGHQHLFLFLAVFSAIGLVATWVLRRNPQQRELG